MLKQFLKALYLILYSEVHKESFLKSFEELHQILDCFVNIKCTLALLWDENFFFFEYFENWLRYSDTSNEDQIYIFEMSIIGIFNIPLTIFQEKIYSLEGTVNRFKNF